MVSNEQNISKIDPKTLIKNVAGQLFAKHGFDGVSVRSIASLAEVNIASINYHFGSKSELYKEIVSDSFFHMREKILSISEVSKSGKDLYKNTFLFMLSESSSLKNSFKIFLSESKTPINLELNVDDVHIGPPGGAILMKALKEDIEQIGIKVKESELIWAVRVLFSQMIHRAIICHSSIIQIKDGYVFDEKEEVHSLMRLYDVCKQDIINNT